LTAWRGNSERRLPAATTSSAGARRPARYSDFERQSATGGGVFTPPGADFGPGATVTIAASLISDNRVAAAAAPCSVSRRRPRESSARDPCPEIAHSGDRAAAPYRRWDV